MMICRLLLVLLAGTLTARASDPIAAPVQGSSAMVSQPHVTVELIPEVTTIQPGQPFDVALHLHTDPGWHTYWINPGDAGIATTIKWTLPPGFTAGPIQWPTPEKHAMGPLVTYGYGGDVYLLTTITPPKTDLPQHFDVKAKAAWLVCQEECIPGKAELTLPLDSGLMNLRLPVENKDFFEQARERLPLKEDVWNVDATYQAKGGGSSPQLELHLLFGWKGFFEGSLEINPKNLEFFPEQPNVLSTTNSTAAVGHALQFQIHVDLEQNGEKPDHLSGVLVLPQSDVISDVEVKTMAYYISDFPVKPLMATVSGTPLPSGGAAQATSNQPNEAQLQGQVRSQVQLGNEGSGSGSASASGDPDNLLSGSSRESGTTGGSPQVSATTGNPAAGTAAATTEGIVARRSTATGAQPLLIAVLGAAFVGGLILNLMPCVLPVLSLKVFSLMKHAGENPKAAWIQGAAFTAGVVLSFWVLAGLLLALRAAGNQLGWGFQMQSPGFVLGLIFLFFLLALNLFGVFELGTSLVGLDAKATGRLGGLASSFGNGALATLAATPCTAPFMGSALGFAAQQPAFISMLIFTFLALGMATPYLLLTIFPGALRFVPKPGAWMEAFKQFMGFLLMATVIFLIYVFGALVGDEQITGLLGTLLFWSLVAWFYGRWGPRFRWARIATLIIFVVYLISMFDLMSVTVFQSAGTYKAQNREDDGWQPWSQSAVDAALAKGQPVFVDFTAAWCLSCKVNERGALDTDGVKQAFAQKNVALFRADWTHSDPAISQTLQKFNRDGVPLYLLYSPKAQDTPQVLPEVLTPGIVLDALKGL